MSAGAGVDLGRTTVRLAEIQARKGSFLLSRYAAEPVQAGEAPAAAAGEVFGGLKSRPRPARVGLTGADLMIRYLPVPEVEDWRLERLMEFEVRELEGKSGAPLATSFNLLQVPKELDDEDTILLGLVREGLLEEWTADLAPVPVQAFMPNAVALYNCFLALGDHEPAVTLLANLGAGTLDLALVRGSDLYFARSVTTGLERRDQILADRLGVDPERAERLIRKHLDLRAAAENKLAAEAERVTRPLLPLYDALPTLLSGVVTLCKAQARLRDLKLDRVLLTGGGAQARGIGEYLGRRMGVPVTVWNPLEMVDIAGLPPEQAEQAEQDGPGAAVALGLALSSADSDLYALEILPKAARRKRDFKERGLFVVAAAVLAFIFLVADFVITSGRADEAMGRARRLESQVNARERSHARTVEHLERVQAGQELLEDLSARHGVARTTAEVLAFLSDSLPATLWVDSLKIERVDGGEWGQLGAVLPVVTVTGRGKDGALPASSVFAAFGEELKRRLPGGEASIRNTTRGSGASFEWTVQAHLFPPAAPADEEEED